jgi:hypothetical protein
MTTPKKEKTHAPVCKGIVFAGDPGFVFSPRKPVPTQELKAELAHCEHEWEWMNDPRAPFESDMHYDHWYNEEGRWLEERVAELYGRLYGRG